MTVTVQDLAAELGVDAADIRAALSTWCDSIYPDRDELGLQLERELRTILDPGRERTLLKQACRACGRWPGPYRFLIGWQPCQCGGHQTRSCRADNGGCGHTEHEPPIDPESCTEPGFGFGAGSPDRP